MPEGDANATWQALRDPKVIHPCAFHLPEKQAAAAAAATTHTEQAQWKAVPNPVDGTTGWWSRCHAQFGWEYRYGSDRDEVAFDALFQRAPAIPAWLLASKLAAETACDRLCPNPNGEPIVFDQCIINRYVDRQGIRNHIDHKMFGAVIACHTLGAGSCMNFWNPHSQAEYNLNVAHNSLYIMSGDVRNTWFHGMPAQQHLGELRYGGGRYSITWRTLNKREPQQSAQSAATAAAAAAIVASTSTVTGTSETASDASSKATIFPLTPEKFCRAFFHVDECFEWKQPITCIHSGGVRACLRNDVQAIAHVRMNGEETEDVVRLYGNQFRGHSEINVHAEEDMVRDERLLVIGATTITVYQTFQPCHHSGGGRSHGHRAHSKSCSELVLEWYRKKLEPRGIKLRIKCCGLYRAHWEEPALFSSRSDAELFGDRTSRAQQGLRLLMRQPGITLEGMTPSDWERLASWTTPIASPSCTHTPCISSAQWAARYACDEAISQFLLKMLATAPAHT
jgi:alkylated DNA repair dioxygenase AlkB